MTQDSGTGFDDVAPAEGVHGHEGPGAAHNGAAAAVAGVAADVARPRGRGPGRSRTLPASAAGVVGFSCPCPHSSSWCGWPSLQPPPAAANQSGPHKKITNHKSATATHKHKNEIWEWVTAVILFLFL
jgi:hypothetical protein